MKKLGRYISDLPELIFGRLPRGETGRLLVASVIVGAAVGFVVALFEFITVKMILEPVELLPIAVLAGMPMLGLAISHLLLRTIGRGASNSTSDEYIKAFHARKPDLPLRLLPVRLAAGAATIGFGGALGLEGPSIYAGSTLGFHFQRWMHRWLSPDVQKLLITAGAAAGVSAVFGAPATGVVFALEAPYRDDVAHRALLPSLMASAASYITFRAMPFLEVETVVPTAYTDRIDFGEIAGAMLIGLGAGIGGRLFAAAIKRAKTVAKTTSWIRLVIGGGASGAALVLISNALYGEALTIGPGALAVDWVSSEEGVSSSLWLLAALFALRAAATLTSVGAGGTGGLFIPLAVQGILLGHIVGSGLDALGLGREQATIWPVLGLAAFLAAGYRTPLAAVMFVAEWTRSGPAVVPALIAAAVSQLVAGSASVASGQKTERSGHLESRLALPLTSALSTDVWTVPPDATVGEFVWAHAIGRRVTTVPVVDGPRYIGLALFDRVADIDRAEWDTTPVAAIVDDEAPTARPSWSLRDATAAMRYDMIAVTDSEGIFIGVVQADEVVRLREILAETGGDLPGM